MTKPSRVDRALAAVDENSHRGLPALISGASNDESRRAFPVLFVSGTIVLAIAEVAFGAFLHGLIAVVVLSVIVGLAWRRGRGGRRTVAGPGPA